MAESAAGVELVVALPTEELLRAVGPIAGVEFVWWPFTEVAPRSHFDIVVPPYLEPASVLQLLDGVSVKLVQSQSIGFDGVAKYLPEGLPFANAASVHETSTAELALGLMLAMQRGIPNFVRAAAEGRWAFHQYQSLADRRVVILGYGAVGREVERRLLASDAEVTRVASSARVEQGPAGHPVQVHGVNDLHALLPHAEIVVLTLPLSRQTYHTVDAQFLAMMADDALLVNVARGRIVDTEALLAETRSGRLRAALDVTDPEPLPADHELWRLPNVLISPHVGGATSAMLPRMAKLVRSQIQRMLAGEPPLNLISLTR